MEAGAHDGHDADDGEGDADDNYYEPLQAGGPETALAEKPTEERADVQSCSRSVPALWVSYNSEAECLTESPR